MKDIRKAAVSFAAALDDEITGLLLENVKGTFGDNQWLVDRHAILVAVQAKVAKLIKYLEGQATMFDTVERAMPDDVRIVVTEIGAVAMDVEEETE